MGKYKSVFVLLLIPFLLGFWYADTVAPHELVVDGVTYSRDNVGIQQAINDCTLTCTSVYVPSGTYPNVTNSSIILHSNLTLRGDGMGNTIIQGSATMDLPVIATAYLGKGNTSGTQSKTVYKDIAIKDLTVTSQRGHIFALHNISGLDIDHVEGYFAARPAIREALFIQHSEHVQVTNSRIHDTAGDGIQLNAVDDFVVGHNLVWNSDDDGIDIDEDFLDTDSIYSTHGTVIANTVRNVPNGNAIRIETANDVAVVANIAERGMAGIRVNSLPGKPMQNITVTANITRDNEFVGIDLQGEITGLIVTGNSSYNEGAFSGTSIGAGIRVWASGASVVGNYVYNGGIEGGGDDGGIVIYKANDVFVLNNTIANSVNGINIWNGDGLQTYTGVSVVHNKFLNVTNPYRGATTQAGVTIQNIGEIPRNVVTSLPTCSTSTNYGVTVFLTTDKYNYTCDGS
jgi:hypothetical protein